MVHHDVYAMVLKVVCARVLSPSLPFSARVCVCICACVRKERRINMVQATHHTKVNILVILFSILKNVRDTRTHARAHAHAHAHTHTYTHTHTRARDGSEHVIGRLVQMLKRHW